MIFLYSGTPGSGKSLDMARMIYYKSKNYPIICNFPVDLHDDRKNSNFHYVDNDSLNPKDLVSFALKYWHGRDPIEDSIFLLIDEAQMLFNAREWSRRDRKSWNAFFSMHRHYGYCIILACQFDTMLDKQIRGLIETEVKHRKLNNMGWRGFFLRFFFFSPTLFIKLHFYYPAKLKTSTDFFRYSKKFAHIYDTYNTSFFEIETGDKPTTLGD